MKVLTLFFGLFITMTAFSQTKKTETVVIHTSAECEACKERIENAMNYTKGISFAELDIESQNLTVKYRTDKITLEEIRQKIADTGYDADEVKATIESQKKLPACCQPGGMEK